MPERGRRTTDRGAHQPRAYDGGKEARGEQAGSGTRVQASLACGRLRSEGESAFGSTRRKPTHSIRVDGVAVARQRRELRHVRGAEGAARLKHAAQREGSLAGAYASVRLSAHLHVQAALARACATRQGVQHGGREGATSEHANSGEEHSLELEQRHRSSSPHPPADEAAVLLTETSSRPTRVGYILARG